MNFNDNRRSVFVFTVIGVLSLIVLRANLCQDVQSLPLKINYPFPCNQKDPSKCDKDKLNFNISLGNSPGDLDIPEGEIPEDGDIEIAETTESEVEIDGDAEIDGDVEVEGEFEMETGTGTGIFTWEPDGYAMPATANSIDLAKQVPELKKHLVGIFIREVAYELTNNNIPSDLPEIDVYLTRNKGALTDADWACAFTAVEARDPKKMKNCAKDFMYIDPVNLSNTSGVGAEGLVKLGHIKPAYLNVPSAFQSADSSVRMDINPDNIGAVSDIMAGSGFKFTMVAVPGCLPDPQNPVDDPLTGAKRSCIRFGKVFMDELVAKNMFERKQVPKAEINLKLTMVVVVKP